MNNPSKSCEVGSTPVVPILMPEAGNTMEEGTVLAWQVAEGDQIAEGDVICEIETDKATIEYESPAAGRLARIVALEGTIVPVKEPIAYLAESDADLVAHLDTSSKETAAITEQEQGTPPSLAGDVGSSDPVEQTIQDSRLPPTRPEAATYTASPAVRRMARELGIELATLGQGSGPHGRILTTDVEQFVSAPVVRQQGSRVTSGSGAQESVRHTMSKMRRRIGQRLQEAKLTIPHFYVQVTICADELYRVKQRDGCSINDLVILACGKVLARFPALRSRIDGDDIIEQVGSHIGIAVGVDEGLLVPVIQDVHIMTLEQVSQQTQHVVAEARRGIMVGAGSGVFTISNLGMFGVDQFTAIINPPEASILAVGAVREQVIVENGVMRPGRVMTMTLSADHRLVDGVTAAKFLAELRELLESTDCHDILDRLPVKGQ